MARKIETKLLYALSLAAQLGFLIIAPLVGFIWLGVFLDRKFSSAPAFLLTGLVIAFALTGYETYHLLEPLLEKNGRRKEKNEP